MSSSDRSTDSSDYFTRLTIDSAHRVDVVSTEERGRELRAVRVVPGNEAVFTEVPIAAHQHQSNSWTVKCCKMCLAPLGCAAAQLGSACSVSGPVDQLLHLGVVQPELARAYAGDDDMEACTVSAKSTEIVVSLAQAEVDRLAAEAVSAGASAAGIPGATSGSQVVSIDLSSTTVSCTWPGRASDPSDFWQFCSEACREAAVDSFLFLLDYDLMQQVSDEAATMHSKDDIFRALHSESPPAGSSSAPAEAEPGAAAGGGGGREAQAGGGGAQAPAPESLAVDTPIDHAETVRERRPAAGDPRPRPSPVAPRGVRADVLAASQGALASRIAAASDELDDLQRETMESAALAGRCLASTLSRFCRLLDDSLEGASGGGDPELSGHGAGSTLLQKPVEGDAGTSGAASAAGDGQKDPVVCPSDSVRASLLEAVAPLQRYLHGESIERVLQWQEAASGDDAAGAFGVAPGKLAADDGLLEPGEDTARLAGVLRELFMPLFERAAASYLARVRGEADYLAVDSPKDHELARFLDCLIFEPAAVSRLLGVFELNGIEVAIDTPGALVARVTRSMRDNAAVVELHDALGRASEARQALGGGADGGADEGDSREGGTEVPPVRGVALFSLVSMMNHSCEPAAVVDYPHGNFTAEVRTLRAVAAGEPITIAYDSVRGGVSARRQALGRYGF